MGVTILKFVYEDIPRRILIAISCVCIIGFHLLLTKLHMWKAQDQNPTICPQQIRLEKLRDYCRNNPLPDNNKRSVGSMGQDYYLMVDQKHRIMITLTPKSGSTLWGQILAGASGQLSEDEDVPNVHDDSYMASIGLRRFNSFSPSEQKGFLANFTKVLLVRHPLDRFASCYHDKFIKSFLMKDTLVGIAYMNKHYRSASNQIVVKKRRQPYLLGVGPEEYTRLVVDPYSPHNEHWATYNSLLNLCGVEYDYIIKMETMAQDAKPILNRLGLVGKGFDPAVHFPHAHRRNTDLYRDDFSRPLALFSHLNSTYVDAVLRRYQHDMAMFGYRWHVDYMGNFLATCGNLNKCC